jgi:hypothetical protein
MAKSTAAASNPLDDNDGWLGKPPGMNEEDLRQFCADANAMRFVKAYGWWYFVRKDDLGRLFVDKAEGPRAAEMRARASGERIEWYRPTPEDSAAIHAFARRMMDQDMTQAEFNEFVRRTGGCKRAVPAGELV